MNAATVLLKSLIKPAPRPKGARSTPSGARIQDMLSAASRRELAAAGAFKLSKPMDPATAQHLTTQRARHRKWAR